MNAPDLPRNIWTVPETPWEGFRWVEMGRTVGKNGAVTLELNNGAHTLYIAENQCQRVPE